jgi:hypothetical protein
LTVTFMTHLGFKVMAAILTFSFGFIAVEVRDAIYPANSSAVNFRPKTPQTESSALEVSAKTTNDTISLEDPSYIKGQRDAKNDIKAGKLIIRVKGFTRFGEALNDEFNKFGIKTQSIGGFFTSDKAMELKGYNEVSKAAINERFGSGTAERAIEKAARLYPPNAAW